VHAQFVREGWADSKVIILFVLGTKDANVSGVVNYASAKYVYTQCFDEGDRFNEIGDDSISLNRAGRIYIYIYIYIYI
jgi:hypothetical protein